MALRHSCLTKWRNILGFWIFGLTNNYPYVIMLSAAFDVIHKIEVGSGSGIGHNSSNVTSPCTLIFNDTTNTTIYPPREPCQRQGTSVILLADILPTFIIKLVAPYFMNFFPYWIRLLSTMGFSLASFLIVALSSSEPVVLFGVVCASISSGFGEITFLSLTAHYHKSTVSAWSSGTGAAGVAGALIYAGLRSFLSPKVTLIIQIFIPVITLVAYFFLLTPKQSSELSSPQERHVQQRSSDNDSTSLMSQDESILHTKEDEKEPLVSHGTPDKNKPSGPYGEESKGNVTQEDTTPLISHADQQEDLGAFNYQDKQGVDSALPKTKSLFLQHFSNITLFNKEEVSLLWDHVKYIPHLFKYMVPLFLVYFAEYGINQTFFELLYAPNTHISSYCLDQQTQYRWLQVIYQVGVLISRSSVSIIYIKHFWILSLLQVINFVFFFLASIYTFLLPSFWLTFFLVLYEGLLGGGVYVNAFYTITKKVPKIHREFSMGVVSIADTSGISVAAVSSIFIHKFICGHFIGYMDT